MRRSVTWRLHGQRLAVITDWQHRQQETIIAGQMGWAPGGSNPEPAD
jgi:hypothetical protein